ncbi:MAG: hypothetical protein KH828_03665 [Clostridiales bacterium]|nr:hypothetical protein [Clostridiales bacterium]
MKDYTLSQQYALIGLDGLESLHMNMAKSAVLRGVAAAKILEEFLAAGEQDLLLEEKLEKGLKDIRKQKKKEAQMLEKEIAEELMSEGVLEEAPDLLASDMNYYTAGVDLKTYRSDQETYTGLVEQVRAEVLEEGGLTRECICLLWLFRESGCMHDLFSVEEQKIIENRMVELAAKDELCRILNQAEFHSSLENAVGNFLNFKKNLFKNPYLEGVNMLYPFLDRRQAIFIDFVVLGTNVASRRAAIMEFLSERGHYVEEVKSGSETLLKIDNAFYRVFPTTVVCKLPIQGAKLLPVYK